MSTRVCFRKFPEGDVVALFPDDVCDLDGNITSYMRIGQHGAAAPDLEFTLEVATVGEYASLLKELVELIGYDDLEVSE